MLQVIDSFAMVLKHISNEFLDQPCKEGELSDNIRPGISEHYSNTSHSSLDNKTPNQAISDPYCKISTKRIHIAQQNRTHLQHKERKQLRDQIFAVVQLTDGSKQRVNKVLSALHDTVIPADVESL